MPGLRDLPMSAQEAGRVHFVRATYRDGEWLDTLPITKENALSHRDRMRTYQSVLHAEVWVDRLELIKHVAKMIADGRDAEAIVDQMIAALRSEAGEELPVLEERQ
ncbi:MAG: hypothetical protein AB7O57_15320 [Hyphomicrobiaceae bacterium]